MSAENSERRDGARLNILGELNGEVMVFQAMGVKDLSVAGARIETPFALQVDSLHEFRLTLGDQSVVVKGRVTHCQISDVEQEQIAYQTGVQFVDLPERVQAAIKQFLETVRSARRGDGD
jgi:hypothetical protein